METVIRKGILALVAESNQTIVDHLLDQLIMLERANALEPLTKGTQTQAPATATATVIRYKKDGSPCKKPGPKPSTSTTREAKKEKKTGKHQCESKTNKGDRCKNMAYIGQKYCQVHC